jgi:hypothetical protein
MRVRISISPRDPNRTEVRGDAEWWLGNRARSGWSVQEDEEDDGSTTLTFEFSDPSDGVSFCDRIVPYEHRGRIL